MEWAFPLNATVANLAVTGRTFKVAMSDIRAEYADLELPTPVTAKDEDVLDFTLSFNDGSVKTASLGLVRGNIVTSKHVGRDIMAGFKNLAGGEIKSYTDMMNEGRDIAEQRMVAEAQAMGANAIICARYASSSVMEGTQEMLAYGTAVRYA